MGRHHFFPSETPTETIDFIAPGSLTPRCRSGEMVFQGQSYIKIKRTQWSESVFIAAETTSAMVRPKVYNTPTWVAEGYDQPVSHLHVLLQSLVPAHWGCQHFTAVPIREEQERLLNVHVRPGAEVPVVAAVYLHHLHQKPVNTKWLSALCRYLPLVHVQRLGYKGWWGVVRWMGPLEPLEQLNVNHRPWSGTLSKMFSWVKLTWVHGWVQVKFRMQTKGRRGALDAPLKLSPCLSVSVYLRQCKRPVDLRDVHQSRLPDDVIQNRFRMTQVLQAYVLHHDWGGGWVWWCSGWGGWSPGCARCLSFEALSCSEISTKVVQSFDCESSESFSDL